MPQMPTATANSHFICDADVLVRELVSQQYNECAEVVFRPPSEGGRRIVTTRKVQIGEIVGRSKNQLMIGPPTTPEQTVIWEKVCRLCDESDHEIIWSALHSLLEEEHPSGGFPLPSITKELQQLICLHFVPEIAKLDPGIVKLHKELGLSCTALKLERMVKLWDCNSMDHTYRDETSILSLGFALMNHSCMPSVSWECQENEVVLRAAAELEAGAELCVTYLDDPYLHKSTKKRQEYIVESGKGFTCGCARCSGPELCRSVACPGSAMSPVACKGLISLGSAKSPAACKKCGQTLSAKEIATYIENESKLEELLEEFVAEDECDSIDDADIEKRITAPESKFVDFEEISPEALETVRKVASSGLWLAPTGHWLAHRAHGLMKDVAWMRKACPSTILELLDQRATFVRNAYPTVAPNKPPILEHGLELMEAAELLLKADGWPSEWNREKCQAAAEARLRESVAVLEPLYGASNNRVIKANKYLSALKADLLPLKRGQKRGFDGA